MGEMCWTNEIRLSKIFFYYTDALFFYIKMISINNSLK